jgi:phosphoribosyl 1,2-cyclic phosphodiesterase
MRARIWGCRGTLATPGPSTIHYGGNTSCVEVRTASGALVVLDAGTGIRSLGASLGHEPRIHLLLTHLHLDHVEGLGFFAPFFDAGCEITIYGPPQDDATLVERVGRYLSPPYYPLTLQQFSARVEFVEVEPGRWNVDGLAVEAARVQHPGPTLAYRLEEDGRSLVYIPDNELGLDEGSGAELASGADVLLHDCQYTPDEYAGRVGWGHSDVERFAAFVERAAPGRALMFHHDPAHDDAFLEGLRNAARELSGIEIDLAEEALVL